MHIIDAACGIGPWSKRQRLQPWRPEEILRELDHFGIDRALVYANSAAHSGGWAPDGNRYVLEQAAAQPRFIPAMTLAPHSLERGGELDQFRMLADHDVRAVWLRPQAAGQAHGIWPWLIGDICAYCSARRLPVFMDVDSLTPNDLHQFCAAFPELRLVLTGNSYSDNFWLFRLLELHPGLHVCLAHFHIPPLGPGDFVRRFGAGRLLFGSGLPLFTPGGMLAHVQYADITDAEKAMIFGGNLERLMQEVQP